MNKNDRLRFWHYPASILIPALLIVPAFIIILSHITKDIDFTRKELHGMEHVHQLNALVHTLQTIRGVTQILQQGSKITTMHQQLQEEQASLANALTTLRKDLEGNPFKVNKELQQLQHDISKNILNNANPLNDKNLFDQHTKIISKATDIRWKMLVHSNLLFDPNLESFFLTDLVATILPNLEETVGRARGLGSGFLAQTTMSTVDRLRLEERLGAIRNHMENVQRSQTVVLELFPQFKDLFRCFPERLNPAVHHFLENSRSLTVENKEIIDINGYFLLGTKVIQTSAACSDLLRENLVAQWHKKLAASQRDKILIIAGACFALLMAIYFVITFYERNQNSFRELQESEQKNQAIVESAVDGILTIDETGIIRSANTAVGNIFGYEPHVLLGRHVSILMPSPHREFHDSYIQSYISSGEKHFIGCTREVIGVCKDGGEFPLELAIGEFWSGNKRFFTGILHDITERQKTKEALQNAYSELERRVIERTQELNDANQKLIAGIEAQKQAESGLRLAAKVFAHASEAIVITDITGTIIDVNHAYTKTTGFQRHEALGKNSRIGKSGRHDQAFYQEMWQTILRDGQWSGEVWDRKQDGTIYPKWLTINAVKDGMGNTTNFVGIFSDISHIKATEERLEQLAFYDPLTSLPNRMLFKERVKHALETVKRTKKRGAIFFIDLDRFKHVNDTLGHAAGDLLLVEISKRLTACVRTSDTVARLGGDEFTIILSDLDHSRDAIPIAVKIIETVSAPIDLDGHPANVGASIGIAMFPDDGDTYDTITKYADVAMYHAKESGRGTYKFFEAEMNAKTAKRAIMEENLHTGLREREFLLHYQPKIDVHSGRMVGMESLVRWQRPDGTLISPADFIPLAEETGLIVPMGENILRMACHYNRILLDSGLPPLQVAVNLSGRQFQDKNLYKLVEAILEETKLPPELLDLEVTESMMMKDEKQAISTLKRLRDIGLSISMDDFGTGYSSLSYLKRFPINALKIDQSFMRDLTVDSDDAAIVLAIVSMAKNLKLRVVAEGVEKQGQWDFLKNIDCHELQGYFISRPLAETAFTDFAKKDTLQYR